MPFLICILLSGNSQPIMLKNVMKMIVIVKYSASEQLNLNAYCSQKA